MSEITAEAQQSAAYPRHEEICKLKALLHSLFIGNVQPYTGRSLKEGLFVFTAETRDIAIHALAMQIEVSLGSNVSPNQYIVIELPPGDINHDILPNRGYFGWQVA